MSFRSRDTPVAPPSINLLARRKPFNPNPADKIPIPMRNVSAIADRIINFNSYPPLAISYAG
jgi:hypothetical protein